MAHAQSQQSLMNTLPLQTVTQVELLNSKDQRW